jgi:hypothetical protein
MSARDLYLQAEQYAQHRDGCPCATQAHAAGDCTCGMYAFLGDLRLRLVGDSAEVRV